MAATSSFVLFLRRAVRSSTWHCSRFSQHRFPKFVFKQKTNQLKLHFFVRLSTKALSEGVTISQNNQTLGNHLMGYSEPPPAERPPGGQREDGRASSRLEAACWTQGSSAEALQDLEPAGGGRGQRAGTGGSGWRHGPTASLDV